MGTAERKYKTIKYCAYALVMIACFVLQSARGTAISLWGGGINALPYLVAAIALFDGPYAGGSFGFFAGLLLSINSMVIEGLVAMAMGLFGAFFGHFGRIYLRQVLPSVLLGGLGYSLFHGGCRYLFYYALVHGISPVYGLQSLLGEVLLSLLPGAAMFFIVRAIKSRFTEGEE